MSVVPAAMNGNGTMLVLWVPALTDTTAPTITELTSGSVKSIGCYITGDGFSSETTENSIEDPRLCSRQVFEARGDYSDSLELTYTWNTVSGDDVARTTLVAGTKGFIVVRWGLPSTTTIIATHKVDVFPVEVGLQRKNLTGRNSMHTITQKMFVTDTVQRDKTVAA